MFLGLVGGALVTVNYLGLALFGCLLIALLIASLNVLKKSIKVVIVSGLISVVYLLPFYFRTFLITGDWIYFGNIALGTNEFTGYLGAVKALFILSTRTNQGGNSCCIGILYLSFLPVVLYFVFKRRVWNIKPLIFLLVFSVLSYFIWLTKIPQARSLLSIFPAYLLLLYYLVDLKKPLYKYAIYFFSCLIIMQSAYLFTKYGYVHYLLGDQSKVDFVYNALDESFNVPGYHREQNEIVNYINLNLKDYDVYLSDNSFTLTLVSNRIFNINTEKRNHKAVFLCQNSIEQNLVPLKHFKSYTLYAY